MCEKRGIFDYGLGGSLFKPALESWFKWDFRCFLHFPRFLFLKNVVLAQGCSVILLLWLGLHSCWALMQHLYDISEYFHLGFNIKMCKWCRESLTSLVDPNNSANRTVKHVSCVWSTCWVRARYKFAKSLEMNWKAWEIGTTSVWRVGGGGCSKSCALSDLKESVYCSPAVNKFQGHFCCATKLISEFQQYLKINEGCYLDS